MFADVLSSASETDSELSHTDNELSDDGDYENKQQDQIEETAKYFIIFCVLYYIMSFLSQNEV